MKKEQKILENARDLYLGNPNREDKESLKKFPWMQPSFRQALSSVLLLAVSDYCLPVGMLRSRDYQRVILTILENEFCIKVLRVIMETLKADFEESILASDQSKTSNLEAIYCYRLAFRYDLKNSLFNLGALRCLDDAILDREQVKALLNASIEKFIDE